MPTDIMDLTAVDSLASGDQFPISSASQGDTRRVSAATLAAFVGASVQTVDNKVTQYSGPITSPATVTITPTTVGQSVWMIVAPAGTVATTAFVLPPASQSADKQEVLINTTQTLTSITMTSTGATVSGAPSTMAAGSATRMRYDKLTTTWYHV